MANHVVWFDIPVKNLDRAIQFYSKVLALEIKKEEAFPGCFMGVLPHENNDVAGCLFESKDAQPSEQGPLLYFNVSGRLGHAEECVVEWKGKILEPKHQIGPYGFRSVVLDSEGNRIALHSEKA